MFSLYRLRGYIVPLDLSYRYVEAQKLCNFKYLYIKLFSPNCHVIYYSQHKLLVPYTLFGFPTLKWRMIFRSFRTKGVGTCAV